MSCPLTATCTLWNAHTHHKYLKVSQRRTIQEIRECPVVAHEVKQTSEHTYPGLKEEVREAGVRVHLRETIDRGCHSDHPLLQKHVIHAV